MTEGEAKTKWCPYARIAYHTPSGGIIPINRKIPKFDDAGTRIDGDEAHVDACCIGSQCMAWRWTANATRTNREGFCGAFGVPSTRREPGTFPQ